MLNFSSDTVGLIMLTDSLTTVAYTQALIDLPIEIIVQAVTDLRRDPLTALVALYTPITLFRIVAVDDPISTVGGYTWDQAAKRSTDLTLLLTIFTGLRFTVAVVTLLGVQRIDHPISTATGLSWTLLAVGQTDCAFGYAITAGL